METRFAYTYFVGCSGNKDWASGSLRAYLSQNLLSLSFHPNAGFSLSPGKHLLMLLLILIFQAKLTEHPVIEYIIEK